MFTEISPTCKFTRNYVGDQSGVSISSLVVTEGIDDVISIFFFCGCLCKQSVSLYVKQKITRWLENMNCIFSC